MLRQALKMVWARFRPTTMRYDDFNFLNNKLTRLTNGRDTDYKFLVEALDRIQQRLEVLEEKAEIPRTDFTQFKDK